MLPATLSLSQPSLSRVLQLAMDLILAGWKRLEMGDVAEAQRQFERARHLCPESSAPLEALGHAARRLGNLRQAIARAEEVIALDPLHVGAHLLSAEALFGLGDEDGALSRLTGMLAAQPDHPDALYLLAHHQRLSDTRHLSSLLQSAQLCPDGRRSIGLALANVYEQEGQRDQATAAAEEAHARVESPAYDRAGEARFLESIERNLVDDALQSSCPTDPRPIFIVGLPHAGASRAERAICSGGGVSAGGPLRAMEHLVRNLPRCVGAPYPRSSVALDDHTARVLTQRYREHAGLGPHARVWTDRCPEGALFLPLALRMFPSARIVHVVRDTEAAARASMLTRYECQDAPYARRTEDFAQHAQFEARLMELYGSRLPAPIHQVRYEDLVEDAAGVGQRLREELGVDEECGPEAA